MDLTQGVGLRVRRDNPSTGKDLVKISYLVALVRYVIQSNAGARTSCVGNP